MKKVGKFGCIISSAIFTVYKFIQFAFNVLAKGLSSLMVSTGLIVPSAYFLFGVVLTALFGFSAADGSETATIYKAGFVISFVLAGVILIYNLFIRPIKRASRARIAKHKLDSNADDAQPQSTMPAPVVSAPPGYRPPQNEQYYSPTPQRNPYPAPARYPSPYDYSGPRTSPPPASGREMPLIYRSKVHEGVIVYEYTDCFRLYREEQGRLVLIKVQPKD